MSFQGTIKAFNIDKGFGFITAADGSDVFVHAKATSDGAIPVKGDVVTYDMEPSTLKPGQMQACNVTGCTGTAASVKGCGKGKGVVGTGVYQGTVKSFNPTKMFGFIVGPEGTDVFLHLNSCVDGMIPQVGDLITYDMEPSKSKPGQMTASNATGGTGWSGGGGGKGAGCGASWGCEGGYGPWCGKGGDGWCSAGGKCASPYGGDCWGGKKGCDAWGKGGDAWWKGADDNWGKGCGWGGKQGGDAWNGVGAVGWGAKSACDSWGVPGCKACGKPNAGIVIGCKAGGKGDGW